MLSTLNKQIRELIKLETQSIIWLERDCNGLVRISPAKWPRQPRRSSRPWRATSRNRGRSPARAPVRSTDPLCQAPWSTGWNAPPASRYCPGSPPPTPRPSLTSSTTAATNAATVLPSGGLCSRSLTWWRWWRKRPSMSPTSPESILPPRSRRTWILMAEGTSNRWELCLCLFYDLVVGFWLDKWVWWFGYLCCGVSINGYFRILCLGDG